MTKRSPEPLGGGEPTNQADPRCSPPVHYPDCRCKAEDRVVERHWMEIEPKDAVELKCGGEIQGPLTQEGEECPWPWDPQQLKGAPLGMYHCPYCGEMVIAGLDHHDYTADFMPAFASQHPEGREGE